jgi:hypothetical protein
VPDNQQLYIPNKLAVGFQKREGTYTGRLAYVIYRDDKGKLRKEASWNSWRDNKIKSIECDNTPTEGFVLNKKVGGYKSDWGFRDAHVRVYDPRDFEFEISVPNLMFILSCCDCSRGKGLEGKFVYAWDKTELVLLPADSDEYRKSQAFTDLQAKKVVGNELIPGATYLTKKQEELVFVGRYDHHFAVHTGQTDAHYRYHKNSPKGDEKGVCKKYVFWDPTWTRTKYNTEESAFLCMDSPAKIGAVKSDVPHPDLAKLIAKYGKSPNGSKVVSLTVKPGKPIKDGYYSDEKIWFAEETPGEFTQFETHYEWNSKTIGYVNVVAKFYLKDGVLIRERLSSTMYPKGKEPSPRTRYNYGTHAYDTTESVHPWRAPTDTQLFAKMENGNEVQVGYLNFDKKKG